MARADTCRRQCRLPLGDCRRPSRRPLALTLRYGTGGAPSRDERHILRSHTEYLAVVASDGHKLVRNQYLTVKSETLASFIMPKKPATLLKNVLSKDGGDVVIRFDGRAAEVNYGDGVLYCRLIEGHYPNYNAVIPSDNPNLLTIDRKILLSAVRRMLPFASDTSELIRFHLENGKLELSAQDIDFATNAKERSPASITVRR